MSGCGSDVVSMRGGTAGEVSCPGSKFCCRVFCCFGQNNATAARDACRAGNAESAERTVFAKCTENTISVSDEIRVRARRDTDPRGKINDGGNPYEQTMRSPLQNLSERKRVAEGVVQCARRYAHRPQTSPQSRDAEARYACRTRARVLHGACQAGTQRHRRIDNHSRRSAEFL